MPAGHLHDDMALPELSQPRATQEGLLAQSPTAPDAVSGAGQGWARPQEPRLRASLSPPFCDNVLHFFVQGGWGGRGQCP